MTDYNMYDFTVKEKDLIRVLHLAKNSGNDPLLLINGMYYDLELEQEAEHE